MVVSAHDRDAIIDVLNLHGHLMDDGALDELDRLFTEDVVYDLEGLGGGQLSGIRAIRDAALALGDRNTAAAHRPPTSRAPATSPRLPSSSPRSSRSAPCRPSRRTGLVTQAADGL